MVSKFHWYLLKPVWYCAVTNHCHIVVEELEDIIPAEKLTMPSTMYYTRPSEVTGLLPAMA